MSRRSAALLMSSFHSRVQAYIEAGLALTEITTRLGDYLHAQIESTRTVTFFLTRFEPTAGELEYVNAGHNPPLLVGRDGKI
ncbi:MAG: SpoIIE family protein phosphatase, partial [Acidobacteriota bacterium]